ncbi:MAG TPA: hypothetical protein PKM65_11520 [Spirochaetota bacterium]|nr:hypothetical protein [Spirochaetota bacterium]HNT09426.1 hypothetical protein [Spirochaetota bacterium]
MHIVKRCPACGKNLRFPVDKGKIRVTCVCGTAFTADPDDPRLFDGAAFDMGAQKKPASRPAASVRVRALGDAVIQGLYSFTYRVQNFRLLPTREKAQVLLVVVSVAALVAAVLIYFLVNPAPRPNSSVI